MDFFVPGRPEEKPQEKKQESDEQGDLAIRTLIIGKRIGLSFEEMNLLRVSDLFDMAREHSGKRDDTPRKATQDDINAFYRG